MAAGQAGAGIIVRSTDYGSTWTQVGTSIAFQQLYGLASKAVAATSTTYYVAVDSARWIYIANGTGETWRKATRLTFPLYGTTIGSNGNAFVAGDGNVIRRSDYTTSYATWTSATTTAPTSTWYDISSFDGVSVIVVGGLGSIYYSVNSGAAWSSTSTVTAADLFCVAHASATTAMVGGVGYLARTTDSGNTWTDMTALAFGTSYTARFHSISILSTSIAYVAAFPSDGATSIGVIYQTTDGGSTWLLVYSTNTPLYSLSMYSTDFGVAGSGAGSSLVAIVSGMCTCFDP